MKWRYRSWLFAGILLDAVEKKQITGTCRENYHVPLSRP
jgi:hypothetical protein